MEIALWLVAGTVVLAYVGAPLWIRRKVRMSADPELTFIRPWQLEPDIVAVLDARGDELEALGLDHLADVRVVEPVTALTVHHRVVADPSRTIVGIATVTEAVNGDRRELHGSTSFGSRRDLRDGTWSDVTTTDTNDPMPFAHPDDHVVVIPEAPAGALLASHRRSLEEVGDVPLVRVASPVEALREDLHRVIEIGVLQGRLDQDPADPSRYRFTLAGAYGATLRNVPPFVGLGRRRRRREGAARLAAIGWSDRA